MRRLTYGKKHNSLNTPSKEITVRKDNGRKEQIGKPLSGAQHIRWIVYVSGADVGSKADEGLPVPPERRVMGDGANT